MRNTEERYSASGICDSCARQMKKRGGERCDGIEEKCNRFESKRLRGLVRRRYFLLAILSPKGYLEI